MASGTSDYTNYSNGLQIAFEPTAAHHPCADDCDRGFPARLIDFINVMEPDDMKHLAGSSIWLRYGIGQQFFTPNDIEIPTIQTEERPYAGWLFSFLDISNEYQDRENGIHYRNNVGLRVGVVGPASLGEDLQKLWHRQCDCGYPQGWDLQLENEPGLIYSIGQDRRLLRREIGGSWSYDVIGTVAASIGNVYAGTGIGGTVRLGWNLDWGWGGRTMEGIGSQYGSETSPSPGFNLFAGMNGRFVARDIFLDGSTWQSSHSVDRKPLVYDQTIGLGFSWRRLDVSVSYVYRSEQYTTQASPTRFGSIVLTWNPAPQ